MPTALLRHLRAPRGLEVDADGFDARTLGEEQPLRGLAEGTGRGGIHDDPGLHFSTGRPACCHAFNPPVRFTTRVKPCFFSAATAFDARSPPSQYTITGRSLRFATSPSPRRDSGAFFAPRIWPAPYSPGSRTSSTSASSRLMRCVASDVLTQGPPVLLRNSGHSSIAPETKATAKSSRLLRMKSKGQILRGRVDHYNEGRCANSPSCAAASRTETARTALPAGPTSTCRKPASSRRAKPAAC